MQRKPFSEIKVNERITFDNGYYKTGHITKDFGTNNGKRLVSFLEDGDDRSRVMSYASHRSVIVYA